MVSDSLKHVVKRRVHLERSQPKDRQRKFGLLEKKKDYVLRAQDFHKKEKTLKSLREKALTRNPDEFYFNMLSSRLDDKGRYQKIEKELTKDQKLRVNSLNRNLVTLKKSADLNATLKARDRLHLIDGACPSSHLLFVDDENEDALKEYEEDDTMGTTSLIDTTAHLGAQLIKNRAKVTAGVIQEATQAAVQITEEIAREYEDIFKRKQRTQTLDKALEALELQNNVAKKGHLRKVKGSDGIRNIHKWQRKRKR